MTELEVRVVSEQRVGLLVELGHIVAKYRYTLLRQRMLPDPQGVSLTMMIRGPDESQMALEEAIAVHPRVLSFESEHVSAVSETSNPVVQSVPTTSSQVRSAGTTKASAGIANQSEVESVLPSIAKDYPRITAWLMGLVKSVTPDERMATLHLAGKRTGVWVYKRDFALGSRLHLAEACKRIVAPAMRELVKVNLDGSSLHVRDNPLCIPGQASGCSFYRGFIEGLLDDSVEPSSVFVRVASCRSDGAHECLLEVSH